MGKITVKHYLNNNLNPEKEDNELYYPLYVLIIVKGKNFKRKSGLLNLYVTEKSFENELSDNPEAKRKIEYERELFSEIIKLFINDFDNKQVRKDIVSFYPLKVYGSKDNFINLLNTYIDFYSSSIFNAIANYCDKEIEKDINRKLEKVFKFENQPDIKQLFKNQTAIQEAKFIYENLDAESIEFFILRESLRRYLAPYNIRTGYDIPLIDWLNNKIQTEFIEFLRTPHQKTPFYLVNDFKIDDTLIYKFINIIETVVKSKNYIELSRADRQ